MQHNHCLSGNGKRCFRSVAKYCSIRHATQMFPNWNLRSNWTCTEYQRESTARKSLLFFFSRKIPVWELFVKPLHSLITPYILLNTSRSLGSFCQVVRAYSVCRKHHWSWCTDLKGLMETPLCQLHRLSQVKCIH